MDSLQLITNHLSFSFTVVDPQAYILIHLKRYIPSNSMIICQNESHARST